MYVTINTTYHREIQIEWHKMINQEVNANNSELNTFLF